MELTHEQATALGWEPVWMRVGDSPLRAVGWVATPEHVPDLLENVAQELRAIQEERDDAAPITELALPEPSEDT